MLWPAIDICNTFLLLIAIFVILLSYHCTYVIVEFQNVALGKPATQSSTAFVDPPGQAMLVVDGQTNSDYSAGSCSLTQIDSPAWWWLDLLDTYKVQQVRL